MKDQFIRNLSASGKDSKKGIRKKFAHFATWVTKATGSSTAFFLAFLVVLVWALTGPLFTIQSVAIGN